MDPSLSTLSIPLDLMFPLSEGATKDVTLVMEYVRRLGTKIVFGEGEEEGNRSKMVIFLGSGVIDNVLTLPWNQLICVD